MNSVAATGEASPRQTYSEGSTAKTVGSQDLSDTSRNDAITISGAVRAGGTGASFGEASTGGGTERPASTGGGETGLGSPGSTRDVGVRGSGSIGEGRVRMERWQDVAPRFRSEWEGKHGVAGKWKDFEPGFRFGWERAMLPEHPAEFWADAEPLMRQQWEAEHPKTPWERISGAVRQGWEGASTRTSAETGLSDNSPDSPLDVDKAA